MQPNLNQPDTHDDSVGIRKSSGDHSRRVRQRDSSYEWLQAEKPLKFSIFDVR